MPLFSVHYVIQNVCFTVKLHVVIHSHEKYVLRVKIGVARDLQHIAYKVYKSTFLRVAKVAPPLRV